MARNLYRVAFAIMTQGNVVETVGSIEHVLIQVPIKEYIGLPKQIVVFEEQAFNKVFKPKCLFRSKIKYIAAEKIPDWPESNEIKPEMIIDPQHWM